MKLFRYEFTEKGSLAFLALPKSVRDRIEKKLRFFIQSGEPLSFAESLKISKKFY